jgi:hypothetical protein
MPELRTFKAFFSYAHQDHQTDPEIVLSFTKALEARVNSKLANARFSIWRDQEGLRAGSIWSERIESQLLSSDILIVLLSPRWIESTECRREYLLFEQAEVTRAAGQYVAPILARSLETQEKHLTEDQRNVLSRLKARQYLNALATTFIRCDDSERTLMIDKMADDIEAMIERLRILPVEPDARGADSLRARPSSSRPLDIKAHDFNEFDFVTATDILIDNANVVQRSIFAQCDFVERLYVEGTRGRIEFGIHRAYLIISNTGPGHLSQLDDLRNTSKTSNVYYMKPHSPAGAIAICIEPDPGRTTLAELAFPPSERDNRLARVANASTAVVASQLTACLDVALSPEGLWLGSDKKGTVSPIKKKWIEDIITIAAKKDATAIETKRLRRAIPIRER